MAERVNMTHGAGGEGMQALLDKYILKHLADSRAEIGLRELDDSGVMDDIVFTTDGHTVKPIFYPGGDIGRLAVCGTINDIAAMGAEPLALALGLLIEDGFELDDLTKIMASIGQACKEAGVPVITGDTKVVEKAAIENIMITTSAIGNAGPALQKNNQVMKETTGRDQRWLQDSQVRPGDYVIITGTIGDHGIALMSFREGYGFETTLKSDNAPLNRLMIEALNAGGLAAAKDPTRGGVANALNEWSEKSKVGILVQEKDLPIKEPVKKASELLGIDPLEVGNEGKFLLAVCPEQTQTVLETIKKNKYGQEARIIGKATDQIDRVVLETLVGGKRIIERPVGDPVPRIC